MHVYTNIRMCCVGTKLADSKCGKGWDRMLGICITWPAKLRKVLGNDPSIANTGWAHAEVTQRTSQVVLWPRTHIMRDSLAWCWEHTTSLHSAVLGASSGPSCCYAGGVIPWLAFMQRTYVAYRVHLTYMSDPATFGSCHDSRKKHTDKS